MPVTLLSLFKNTVRSLQAGPQLLFKHFSRVHQGPGNVLAVGNVLFHQLTEPKFALSSLHLRFICLLVILSTLVSGTHAYYFYLLYYLHLWFCSLWQRTAWLKKHPLVDNGTIISQVPFMLNKEIRVFVCVLLLKPSWLYLKKFKNSRGDTRHQRKLLKIDWNLKPNTRRLWGISFLYSSFINATWKENRKSSGDECLAPGSLKWEKQQHYRKSSQLATSFTGVCKLFGLLVLYHLGNLHITQDAEKGVRSFCKHNPNVFVLHV